MKLQTLLSKRAFPNLKLFTPWWKCVPAVFLWSDGDSLRPPMPSQDISSLDNSPRGLEERVMIFGLNNKKPHYMVPSCLVFSLSTYFHTVQAGR